MKQFGEKAGIIWQVFLAYKLIIREDAAWIEKEL